MAPVQRTVLEWLGPRRWTVRSNRRVGKQSDPARPFPVPHGVSANRAPVRCTKMCCARRTTSATARDSTQPRGERDLPSALSSERWAAPVYLELVTTNAPATDPEVVSELHGRSTNHVVAGRRRGLEARVLDILAQGPTLTRTALWDSLGFKSDRLGEVLTSLELLGRLCRNPLMATPGAVPVPHRELRGNERSSEHQGIASGERGGTVPGVDFDRVRTEITVEQVLSMLRLQPSTRLGVQWHGSHPLHELNVAPCPARAR